MANTLIENTSKTVKKGAKATAGAKLVKTTGKAVKKNAQYKAASKAVKTAAKKTSTRTKAGVFLVVGATTAAGAYLVSRRGGDDQGDGQQADLTDPAVAAGV
jgi:hypothetical protein